MGGSSVSFLALDSPPRSLILKATRHSPEPLPLRSFQAAPTPFPVGHTPTKQLRLANSHERQRGDRPRAGTVCGFANVRANVRRIGRPGIHRPTQTRPDPLRVVEPNRL